MEDDINEKHLWVGDEMVSYYPDGRISSIGLEKVVYDSEERIILIGDDLVRYNNQGKIAKIGDHSVIYDNENCILFTGSDTVIYEQSHNTIYFKNFYTQREVNWTKS